MRGARCAAVLLGVAGVWLPAGCHDEADPDVGDDAGDARSDDAEEGSDAVPDDDGVREADADLPDDVDVLPDVAASCGDGTLDPGEECDGDAPRPCTTTCGSTGTQACVGCRWEVSCSVPADACNGLDDDCNGVTDDFGLLGPEVVVSETDTWESHGATVAWADGELGIAWSDGRDGGPTREIYFARVSAAGTLADVRRRLTFSGTHAWGADIAFTGDSYALTWRDYRFLKEDVFLLRMSRRGEPLAPELRVSDDSAAANMPALAWTGAELGLTWVQGDLDGTSIRFARFAPDGSLIRSAFTLADAPYPMGPVIASSAAGYAVAWAETSGPAGGIRFVRLDSVGEPLGSALLVVDTGGARILPPSIAPLAPGFAITWLRPGPPEEVMLTRLDAAGALLGEVVVGTCPVGCMGTAAAAGDGGIVVAWVEEFGSTYVERVTADGSPSGAALRVNGPDAFGRAAPAFGFRGAEGGIVWGDGLGSGEVYSRRLGGCIR